MKAFENLPENYKEICSIDLNKDKKVCSFINVTSIVIALLLFISMLFIVPFSTMINLEGGLLGLLLKYVILFALIAVYLVLHELIHGIAMKMYGTKKVKYGFTGLYAFAGSNDYYTKKAYIFIALAPVVLLGIIVGVVNALVPVEWFWIIYLIQIVNLSGATDDLFVTIKFSRLPKDILVQDYGVSMKVFSKD